MTNDNGIDRLSNQLDDWINIREDGACFLKKQAEQINSILMNLYTDKRSYEDNKYILEMVDDSICRLKRLDDEVSALSAAFIREVSENEMFIKEEISRLSKG